MAGKKRRRRISAGTLAMLLLTGVVLALCAGFFALIAGEAMHSRAAQLMQWVESSALVPDGVLPDFRKDVQIVSSMSPVPQATQMPQARVSESSRTTITVAAAGTVAAPKAIRSGAVNAAGDTDFAPVFEGLGDLLAGADLAIATLETVTAGEEKGFDNFNAPAQILTALRERGVDLLSLATERALDMGEDGLQITIGEVIARGMAYAGAQTDGAAQRSASLIGIDGVQVAVLAYTYGLSEIGEAHESGGAVSVIDAERMVEDIRQARADGANVVIVLPHWGTKNKAETPEEVRRLARILAKAGADVILGTHPNVVQGTERLRVERADGLEYETVVCYSLGSLLTDARTGENTAGMVAQLQITYDSATRRVYLGSLACLPVYIARERSADGYVYRVVDVENRQAMEALSPEERAAAQAAAWRVRDVTGQSRMEDEGEG